MNRDTERKRIYLESYARLGRQLADVEVKIADFENNIKSPCLDGMPRAVGRSSDLSLTVMLFDEYREERARIKRERRNIEDAVHALEDPDERAVIYLKYIEGLSLVDIFELWLEFDPDITYEGVRYFHRRGLHHIPVKTEVYMLDEC